MRLLECLSGKSVDRIPFVPAVYEHKAFLIGETPSAICRDASLLVKALKAEYEIYKADLLVVGVDVYNVEAEALGAAVKYFTTNETPVISKPLLDNPKEICRLKLPNPRYSGRMPLLLSAGREISRELEKQVPIWGAITGPFSLAAQLVGVTKLLLTVRREPGSVCTMLDFTTRVAFEFAKGWRDAGLGVVIFDSFCAPPLVSPSVYFELIFPYHAQLMELLRDLGLEHRPLIIGGNTTSIARYLMCTGTTFVICDYNADKEVFIQEADKAGIAVRMNVDPLLVYNGPEEAITKAGEEIVKMRKRISKVILGTGVLPYATPPTHVLALKKCAGMWAP